MSNHNYYSAPMLVPDPKNPRSLCVRKNAPQGIQVQGVALGTNANTARSERTRNPPKGEPAPNTFTGSLRTDLRSDKTITI